MNRRHSECQDPVDCNVRKMLLLVLLATVILVSPAISEEVSRDKLLDMLQGLESNIQVLEYRMEFKRSNAIEMDEAVDFSKSIGNLSHIAVDFKLSKKTHCILEPGTGRIRVTRDGTGSAQEAGSPDVYIREFHHEIGFDGLARTQLRGLPTEGQTGIINEEPLHINRELSSFEMAMDMFLPCYKGIGLSKYLGSDEVEGDSVWAFLRNSGILEVVYVKNANKQKIRLLIDIEKGGAILSEEYFGTSSEERVDVKMEYSWSRNEYGYWVPQKCIGVSGALRAVIYLWNFEKVEINHFRPIPETYRVTFPFGTHVEDQRLLIGYLVGELPHDVALESQNALEQTFEMNPDLADDTKAVSLPSAANTIAPESTLDNDRSRNDKEAASVPADAVRDQGHKNEPHNVICWLLGCMGFLGLAVFTFRYVHSKKKASLLIILALVVHSIPVAKQDCFAGTSKTITKEEYDGWTAKGAGEEKIPVYQCGVYSTTYILEYFKVKYSIEQLMALMSPTARGIPLSDIIRSLRLHGFEVCPRKRVSADDLHMHISKDLIALLPTDTRGKKGHYYVVVPGKKYEFLLINVGISVTNCPKRRIKEYLNNNDGIVVFISREGKINDATEVNILTDKCDLGKFARSSQEAVVAKILLENTSTREILLKDVIAPCSCISINCIGEVIDKEGTLDARLQVMPRAWGIGKKEKDVTFVFGDGSVKKVKIEGECIDEQVLHNLKVKPSELYINMGEAKGSMIRRQLKVFAQEGPIHIGTDDYEWLQVTLFDGQDADYQVIEVKLDPNKFDQQQVEASLFIWCKEGIEKMRIPIHISTPKHYSVTPRIGKIDLPGGVGGQSTASFEITPRMNEVDVRIIDVSTDEVRLLLDWLDGPHAIGNFNVSVKDTDIASGLYPSDVRFSVRDNNSTERLYVLIK